MLVGCPQNISRLERMNQERKNAKEILVNAIATKDAKRLSATAGLICMDSKVVINRPVIFDVG